MKNSLILLGLGLFFAVNLNATPLRSGAQVLDTAIHLKKMTDRRNMEDFEELQRGITRVLERQGGDIFAILAKSRSELHKKIIQDIYEIAHNALGSYVDRECDEYKELENLITTLWSARNLLVSRHGLDRTLMMRNFFSDRYILSVMKEHSRELVAAKVALIYILQHISQESIMNLKALKVNHSLTITNLTARESLKKTALYDHEEEVLYIPNSGFILSGEPSLEDFKGTDAPGFIELCLFGTNTHSEFTIQHFIQLWKIQKEGYLPPSGSFPEGVQVIYLMARLEARPPVLKPSDLKPGDLLVTRDDIRVLEKKPETLEKLTVIHNTRTEEGEKEGIVAETIPLPSESYWVLRPRG